MSAPRELLIYVLSVCVCVVLSFYHVSFWDQTQVVRVGSRLYDLLRNLAGPTGTFSSVHPGGAKALSHMGRKRGCPRDTSLIFLAQAMGVGDKKEQRA